jgi:branched-chain amino acid transport system permease protein
MRSNRLLRAGAILLGIAALALFPIAIANPYYIHLLETIMIYAILLFGLDIVVGYTGQVSLGHAGLFGIGASAAGVMDTKLETPLLVTLIGAIGITSLLRRACRAAGAARHRPVPGDGDARLGTIIQILINEMTFLTEGPLGIKLTKPALLGLRLDEQQFFWLVAGLLVLSLVFVHNVLRSHLGRAFEALRGSPVAADCMGVSVYRYKVYAFVISAGLAGLAGALYSFSEQYISPNTYNFELTVLFLLAVIMGGRKTRVGAMLGATIIVLLPKLLDDLELFRYVSVGLAIIVALVAVFAVRRGKRTPRQMIIPVVGSLALAALSFVLQTMTDWRLSIFGLITLFVVYYLQDGIVGYVPPHSA